MKATGRKTTRSQERQFKSIANHVQGHSESITREMKAIQRETWEGVDTSYIQGKIKDLKGSLAEIRLVLSDMVPELELELED